jgi:hypothetical protein
VDLATNLFDVAPLKTKDSNEVLKEMLNMFKHSKYIKKPYSSIGTDAGSEFAHVFNKWCYDNSIYHKTSLPARHTQTANVESLNRLLGRLLNNYMSQQELDTGYTCTDWISILPAVVKELNEFRINKSLPKNIYSYQYPNFTTADNLILTKDGVKKVDVQPSDKKLTPVSDLTKKNLFEIDKNSNQPIFIESLPKFKVGDFVMKKLDQPKNALGHNQTTSNFREGDIRWDFNEPRKIKRILYMNTPPFYRYLLNGVDGVSYSENQLQKSTKKVELYKINRISDRMKKDGKIYYKVHWANAKEHKPTWELKDDIIKDVPLLIEAFDNKRK